ncbi:hypothetical protein BP6252_08873 [Coleophoma cylindrospora]|uniref:alpha-amylase n=1 Tax=Coleophoma cylindrospora TaxID=1849047 RepID=A0A3D8R731_9HELO|nr:hypothetical protein BP6252_08873 [Coleophoma cylindrospora]
MFHHAEHIVVAIVVWCLGSCDAASSADWRSRAIYQVFTDRFARTDGSTTASCSPGYEGYCGGSWKGIISKLDYIQDMGFTAVWISPVVQQVSDPTRAYTGYAATDIYALNSNFGTASDLTDLASALHDRGMYLMIDVVANHMAFDGTAETVDYSNLNPFNNQDYFHRLCWIDNYNNQTNLEDACLYPSFTREVTDLRSSAVDGLRVDTVKNVEKEFWSVFNTASGIYNLGEVSNGNVDYFCPYQDHLDGLIDYPTYYQATQFFANKSATSTNFVKEVQALNGTCNDTTLLGTFSENHDQPRFASYTSDLTVGLAETPFSGPRSNSEQLAKNIITYTMLADGIPIIYQGQEQHFSGGTDPYNREALWLSKYHTHSELYQTIKNLNLIRAVATNQSSTFLTSTTTTVYSDDNTVVFGKGESDHMVLTVVSNLGRHAKEATITIPAAGLPKNIQVTDVVNCHSVDVDANGGLEIKIKQGRPMVFYPRSLMESTDLCKGKKSAATPTYGPSAVSWGLAFTVSLLLGGVF